MPTPLQISIHLLAATVLIKPNRFQPSEKDIRKTILTNKQKRKNEQIQSWMGALCSKTQPHSLWRASVCLRNRQHRLCQSKGWTALLYPVLTAPGLQQRRLCTIWEQAEPESPQNSSFYVSADLHIAVPSCSEIRAVDTWQIPADRLCHEEKALPPKYFISQCCALNKSVSCLFQRSERHAGQNFKL